MGLLNTIAVAAGKGGVLKTTLACHLAVAATHGGRAWVEENPSGGASFRVELPLRQP